MPCDKPFFLPLTEFLLSFTRGTAVFILRFLRKQMVAAVMLMPARKMLQTF